MTAVQLDRFREGKVYSGVDLY